MVPGRFAIPFSVFGGKVQRKAAFFLSLLQIISLIVLHVFVSVTLQFHDAVCKIHHKDTAFYHALISHDISKDQFISVHIDPAYILKDCHSVHMGMLMSVPWTCSCPCWIRLPFSSLIRCILSSPFSVSSGNKNLHF